VTTQNNPIKVPDPGAYHVLRHVMLDGYRLLTWETGKRFHTRQHKIGYALWQPGHDEPLFVGEDCGVAPSDSIDGDGALRGLMGFLTLKPGDTDDEYFENYTPEQLAFAESDAEQMSMWGMDPGDFEHGENIPQFEDIETWT
jgi:hypothetical protein